MNSTVLLRALQILEDKKKFIYLSAFWKVMGDDYHWSISAIYTVDSYILDSRKAL